MLQVLFSSCLPVQNVYFTVMLFAESVLPSDSRQRLRFSEPQAGLESVSDSAP